MSCFQFRTSARGFCFLALAVLLSELSASPAHAIFGTFSTSGVYDEQFTDTNVTPGPNPAGGNAMNAVDLFATGNNVGFDAPSFQIFKDDIAAAFNANKGGVISFDNDTNATSQVDNQFVALVGANQGTLLTVTRVVAPGQPPGTFGMNNNNDHQVISGYNYLGIAGVSTHIQLNFSLPLRTFGITALGRATNRMMQLVPVYDDGTTPVPALPTNTVGNDPSGDMFFGWTAPAERTIVAVRFNNSTFIRYDDMGIILANFQQGDADGDLDVDMNDYNLIRNNFGKTPAVKAEGDVNLDGTVNILDFQLWKANEASAAGGAITGVPEPSSLALAAIGVLAAIRRRRR